MLKASENGVFSGAEDQDTPFGLGYTELDRRRSRPESSNPEEWAEHHSDAAIPNPFFINFLKRF